MPLVLPPSRLAAVRFRLGQLDPAVAGPAPPNVLQVGIIERQPVEIVNARWVGETTDGHDDRALLQLRDVPNPRDQPLTVDLDGHRAENGDLLIASGEHTDEGRPSAHSLMLSSAQLDQRVKERQGTGRALCQQRDLRHEQTRNRYWGYDVAHHLTPSCLVMHAPCLRVACEPPRRRAVRLR